MRDKIDTTKDNVNTFTVRFDSQLIDMINYLKAKKMLNKTALIRLAIAALYNQEKYREVNGGR